MKNLKWISLVVILALVSVSNFSISNNAVSEFSLTNLHLTAQAEPVEQEICFDFERVWVKAYIEYIYDDDGNIIGSVYHEGHWTIVGTVVPCE